MVVYIRVFTMTTGVFWRFQSGLSCLVILYNSVFFENLFSHLPLGRLCRVLTFSRHWIMNGWYTLVFSNSFVFNRRSFNQTARKHCVVLGKQVNFRIIYVFTNTTAVFCCHNWHFAVLSIAIIPNFLSNLHFLLTVTVHILPLGQNGFTLSFAR